MSRIEFVIFDLDGTLVDSEALCNKAFLDLVPELRERTSVEQLMQKNRGRKLAEILVDLEFEFGVSFNSEFAPRYRKHVEQLFSSHLQPVEGVPEMLEAIDIPKCVASSGPPEKIRHALKTCGILHYFEGAIYSSYEVGSWKPDPGLYQFAMSRAGFHSSQCAVVEDSEVGIQAATAAGIRVFLYDPDRLQTGVEGWVVFESMTILPGLIYNSGGDVQQSDAGDVRRRGEE